MFKNKIGRIYFLEQSSSSDASELGEADAIRDLHLTGRSTDPRFRLQRTPRRDAGFKYRQRFPSDTVLIRLQLCVSALVKKSSWILRRQPLT